MGRAPRDSKAIKHASISLMDFDDHEVLQEWFAAQKSNSLSLVTLIRFAQRHFGNKDIMHYEVFDKLTTVLTNNNQVDTQKDQSNYNRSEKLPDQEATTHQNEVVTSKPTSDNVQNVEPPAAEPKEPTEPTKNPNDPFSNFDISKF